MNDLEPMLRGGAHPEEARLLRSAELDVPPPGGKSRMITLLGVGAGGAVTAAAAQTHAAVTTGVVSKWLAVGALAGSVTTGSLEVARWYATEASRTPVMQAAGVKQGAPPAVAESRATADLPMVEAAPPRLEPAAPPSPRVGAGSRERAGAARASVELEPEKGSPPLPATAPSLEPSLANEVAAIDRARAALVAHDSPRALSALEDHARAFTRPRLAPEALLIRVEALLMLRRDDEARALGERYLRLNPRSSHAQRIRSLLDATAAGDPNAPRRPFERQGR